MHKKLALERILRRTRSRPKPDPVDAADVGTADGLELSIDASQRTVDEANTPRVEPQSNTTIAPPHTPG